MSAVVADDLLIEGFIEAARVPLRVLPGGLLVDQPSIGQPSIGQPCVDEFRVAAAGESAVVTTLPASSRGASMRLRLTNRGIAVILGAFVALFATGVAVVVTSFLAVSDAPDEGPVAAVMVR